MLEALFHSPKSLSFHPGSLLACGGGLLSVPYPFLWSALGDGAAFSVD